MSLKVIKFSQFSCEREDYKIKRFKIYDFCQSFRKKGVTCFLSGQRFLCANFWVKNNVEKTRFWSKTLYSTEKHIQQLVSEFDIVK